MTHQLTKRVLSFLLAFALVFALVPVDTAQAAKVETVTLLHTNDIHGNVEGDPLMVKDAKTGEMVKNEKASKIGYPRYKTIIDDFRAKSGNVIVLDAGDATHGTNLATISEGAAVINMMNALGVDALAPGNHDFNYGYERLKLLEADAIFPILAANVVVDKTGEKALGDHVILTTDGGVKVGVFGLATPETKTKSNPVNTEGLAFREEIATAQAQVKALKDGGAQVIVFLSHLGMDEESKVKSTTVAKAVSGIDVIIDGHSHTLLPNGQKEGDVLIASTGNYLENIGKVEITLTDGVVTDKKASLITFAEASKFNEDPKILTIIDEANETNETILEKVVGKTATELDGVREHVRGGETNLGNLLTDAMIAATGADVALTNGGGIRASIPAGEVTMGKIMTAFPFNNAVTVIEVTGKDIVDALKFGVDAYPEVAGKFPHVGGMSYQILTGGEKNDVVNIVVNGAPIDVTKTYKLATNDFMAVGGDGYDMFKGKPQVTLSGLLSEAVAEHITTLTKKDGQVDYKVEGRITEVSNLKTTRIYGDDRMKTAIALSAKSYEKADTVVLADALKYADALSVSPLATQLEAPILLVANSQVTDDITAEIQRLGAKNILLVGGTNALSADVEAKAKTLGAVERLGGLDRYATALLIADRMIAMGADTKNFYVTSGENYPDAMSVAALAAIEKTPVLLSRQKALNPEVEKALKTWDVKALTLVGGTAALSQDVENAAKVLGKVERLAGDDRYETNLKVAAKINTDAKIAYTANGMNFADALTAAPVAAKGKAPLVLVNPDKLNDATKAYIDAQDFTVINIVGGINAVSAAVEKTLSDLVVVRH